MYDYTFDGWDKKVINCNGNAIYIATFKQNQNAEYKSAQLLNELNEIIDSITIVNLNTYFTIIAIQERASELTESDKIKLNIKLQPILTQYTNYVKSINSEYAVAEDVEKKYFIAVLEMINYLTILTYAVFKGKRWFI